MELLIYNTDNWMDKLDSRKLDKANLEMYTSRYQKGDIVEVRPDGYWTGKGGKGYRTDIFTVISLPGEPNEDLMKPVMDGDKVIKCRRFNIDKETKQLYDAEAIIG